MSPILKNIIAVIAGIVVGSIVNMALVMVSGSIIPPPEGVDPSDMESLKSGMHLFEAKHFIFPFLAHALGTLVGAFVAAKVAATNKMKFAIGVGGWFLLGGIAAVMMIDSPLWFTSLDLIVAYIPMAYIGGKLANRK